MGAPIFDRNHVAIHVHTCGAQQRIALRNRKMQRLGRAGPHSRQAGAGPGIVVHPELFQRSRDRVGLCQSSGNVGQAFLGKQAFKQPAGIFLLYVNIGYHEWFTYKILT